MKPQAQTGSPPDARDPLAPEPLPLSQLLARVREITLALEAVKPLYEELDALVLEVVRQRSGATGLVGTLADGTHALLVDNFVDRQGLPRNTAWKACGVKRFELDFTDEASSKRKERAK